MMEGEVEDVGYLAGQKLLEISGGGADEQLR